MCCCYPCAATQLLDHIGMPEIAACENPVTYGYVYGPARKVAVEKVLTLVKPTKDCSLGVVLNCKHGQSLVKVVEVQPGSAAAAASLSQGWSLLRCKDRLR